MFAVIWEELGVKAATVIFGVLLGAIPTFLLARWRRMRERRSIMRGDARDTVVIVNHLVETAVDQKTGNKIPKTLRIRSLGQSEVGRVVPNGHLAAVLHNRTYNVSPRDTLISMDGAEGSYLLETLTNFVCDRVCNGNFEHDLYVMAPCCEPAGLALHQPVTILLIAVSDLILFEDWVLCREIQVEHGSDGARILTLMNLARRYRHEQTIISKMRQEGKRTLYIETMYILDLALDKRTCGGPTREVPWGRYEGILRDMNLEERKG
jgi:hypothetical protein